MARFDLHFHTLPSSKCSHMSIEQGIDAAIAAGLDGIVLTEHNMLWDEADLGPHRRGVPSTFRIFRGMEVNCRENHFLVYGIEDSHGIYYGIPAAELIEVVHSRGGVVVAAHPYRWERWQGDISYGLELDGIEIDSNNTSIEARRLAERLAEETGFRPIVASDAHSVEVVGSYWQTLPDDLESVIDLANFLNSQGTLGANTNDL
jgi:predicted metal-dependent phosphoesterase TrpH